MSTVFDPMKAPISLHGLGFIQVQLQGDQRLHVWHPELPRRKCFEHSAIHNHRFAFKSTVLVGTMRNIVYGVQQTGTRDPDGQLIQLGHYMTYSHEGARTSNGGRPWLADQQVDFTPLRTDVIPAGQQYLMPDYTYHKTEPMLDGKVATIMQKLSEGDRCAHSACLIALEPDTDFDRFQLSPEQLWAYVLDVLSAGSMPLVGGTSSNQYRAELYDEVWQRARDMGYANVTEALITLSRLQSGSPAGLDNQQQEAGQ